MPVPGVQLPPPRRQRSAPSLGWGATIPCLLIPALTTAASGPGGGGSAASAWPGQSSAVAGSTFSVQWEGTESAGKEASPHSFHSAVLTHLRPESASSPHGALAPALVLGRHLHSTPLAWVTLTSSVHEDRVLSRDPDVCQDHETSPSSCLCPKRSARAVQVVHCFILGLRTVTGLGVQSLFLG